MSGGSLSYLYNKQFPEVCNYIDEMKKVEKRADFSGIYRYCERCSQAD